MKVLFFLLTLTLVMCWGLSQKALAINEYLNEKKDYLITDKNFKCKDIS